MALYVSWSEPKLHQSAYLEILLNQQKEIFQKLFYFNINITDVEAAGYNLYAGQKFDGTVNGKVNVMLERPVFCIWMYLVCGFHICYPQALP